MLYSVKEEEVDGQKKYTINKFTCLPLKDDSNDAHWLLQYPCSINAYIEGGRGTMIYNQNRVNSITTSVEYNGEITISFNAADGYKLSSVTIVDADTLNTVETITEFEDIIVNSITYKGIIVKNISKNLQIKVSFEVNA